MERILQKMAQQLNACDEASLSALWNKYQQLVQNFSSGPQWEEAVLILSMIQGVRWKNQLFNHHWARQYQSIPVPDSGPVARPALQQKCKILTFRQFKKS